MAGRQQLQAALQQPYDRTLFIREVLHPVFGQALEARLAPLPPDQDLNASDRRVIDSVVMYAAIRLEDGGNLTCYEIRLQPSVRLEHSRVAIQQYVRRFILAGDAALINFVSPHNLNTWRLTLLAKESLFVPAKGTQEKLTHPKRYTYLLGSTESCRTAAERLEALSAEPRFTLEALTHAFSVERLSKAFFDEYRLHYNRFCDYLKHSDFRRSVFGIAYPADASAQEREQAEKPIRDFVKKMMGRIVFLYFVQKKGWLGATDTRYHDGLPDFISRLFHDSGGDDTFYPRWLAPLFFETLNRKRPDDNFTMPDGSTRKVPFLNGGLFDREAYDDALLIIPARFFHHPDLTVRDSVPATKTRPDEMRGFLDFLNAYNFTVREDSPDDHTVAVDPEMLGRIFENLLEDNNDKGAFYTPKHIVHYMCQESLIEYLTNHLSKEYKVYRPLGSDQVELFGNEHRKGQLKLMQELGEKALDRDQLAQMVRYKQLPDLSPAQLQRVDELLDAVKICDPAIGSGAFPMGLLQEIYALKELIAFRLGKPWQPARVKQNIIQNSIYGVDIERGAVDIARLRFWLSLVVDESYPQPLPNLDYKIMQGNALIETLGDVSFKDMQLRIGTEAEKVRAFARLKHRYFNADSPEEKKHLRQQIDRLMLELVQARFEQQIAAKLNQIKQLENAQRLAAAAGTAHKPAGKKARAEKIMQDNHKQISRLRQETEQLLDQKADLERQFQQSERPFFFWELFFGEIFAHKDPDQNGFDLVIGNPPYIPLQNKGGKLAKLYETQGFQTFTRTGDIYSLFYEKGMDLLKPGGTLNFITSNKWMRADYGKSTRAFFLKYNPLKLIDLGSGVFSATVDTNILLIQKAPNQNRLQALDVSKEKNVQDLYAFADRFVTLQHLTAEAWTIADETSLRIKAKIEAKGTPLKNWDVQIYRGVLTGYNEAFIIDSAKREEILARCQSPEERQRTEKLIKPILRGRDIKRYRAEWAGLWLIFVPWHFPLHQDPTIKGASEKAETEFAKQYPAVYNHLLSHKEALSNRNKAETGIRYEWYALQRWAADYHQEFEKEKIIYPNMTLFLPFIYDDKGYLTNQKCFIITSKSHSLKFLTGVLNSKVAHRWIRENCPELQGGTRELSKVFFENIPIPRLSETEQRPIVALVEEILAKKERGEDTASLEQEIDLLVYRLYGLSYEEVRYIDPSFPLSREEYGLPPAGLKTL